MKKLWLIPLGIALIGVVTGGVLVWQNNQAQTVSPTDETAQGNVPTPTPKVELATWTDEAGFSFLYPKDLTVDKHEEDPDNYAHVELTSKDHPGSVIVWVSDLPRGVTDLTSWVKLKQFAGATVLDSTLGEVEAKKLAMTTPTKKLFVGTISDGLLFYIDATLTDNEYWTGVANAVADSFRFTLDTQAPQGGSGGAPAASEDVGDVDETEVVE